MIIRAIWQGEEQDLKMRSCFRRLVGDFVQSLNNASKHRYRRGILKNRIKPHLSAALDIARQRRAVEIYGCFKPFCRVYENSRIYCMSLKRHYISKSEPHNAKILSVFGLFPRLKSTSQTKGQLQWKITRRIKKQCRRRMFAFV